MLKIFICESNEDHRIKHENVIANYLKMSDLDCQLELSSDNPKHLLDYLSASEPDYSLFFIAIDLGKQNMNGFKLAESIRNICPYARIVFITSHVTHMSFTFTYKLEILDYIVKDKLKYVADKIIENIEWVYDEYKTYHKSHENISFPVKDKEIMRFIDIDDILYFETSCEDHYIILHHLGGHLKFRGNLVDISNYCDSFMQTHQSYVVNIRNIYSISLKERWVQMTDGGVCMIAQRRLPEVKNRIQDYSQINLV
ncbi:LytTR family DNA-binding domain-containing protein [Aerococcus sp. UMB7834]|uniref:LytR/AlgR family response regulator transcription factor n=1 Tax=Aerococcus sp. UMB7834 TaxID=3046342 RepID=UPI002550A484|nr:LytTR family DNA-binding domain-containing protein [Aerococcus sp. UMB7834]MDK6805695.1 LytTR family DNA-binding domain-containing protein [Aerococcus sp. UMB7834]